VHSPRRSFKLGHDSTRVSPSPRTATQTPISVSSASVDRVCDWAAPPAVGSRGMAAARVEETMCALNRNGVKYECILEVQMQDQ